MENIVKNRDNVMKSGNRDNVMKSGNRGFPSPKRILQNIDTGKYI